MDPFIENHEMVNLAYLLYRRMVDVKQDFTKEL